MPTELSKIHIIRPLIIIFSSHFLITLFSDLLPFSSAESISHIKNIADFTIWIYLVELIKTLPLLLVTTLVIFIAQLMYVGKTNHMLSSIMIEIVAFFTFFLVMIMLWGLSILSLIGISAFILRPLGIL